MEVFAWGANSHGQLGLRSFTEFEAPTRVEMPERISQISGGGGHTIIMNENGELWATGWNNKGQLGIGSTKDCNSFVKVNCNHRFDKISCGWDSSAGITSDNRLFVWGSNSHGQLGLDKNIKMLSVPMEIPLLAGEEVVDIQFGLRHSVVLTKLGNVYIYGSLKHFKVSEHLFIKFVTTELLRLKLSKKVRQIASGQNHILVLFEDNSLEGFGDNKFGQCAAVKSEQRIVKIACGWTHNAFLTDEKELFLYGRNNYGQLGDGSRDDKDSPQKCSISPVEDFQLGAEHGILKSNGEIFTWGWNEHANCGNGAFEDVLQPVKVQLPNRASKLESIAAGSGYCMVTYVQER